MPSPPVAAAQDDDSVPPAEPVAASRRWAVIVGVFTVTAAVWIVATGGPFDRTTTPADKPTRNPEGKTAEDVATDFFNAYSVSNEDHTLSVLADDADLYGWGLNGTREFRLLMRFFEATGFKHILDTCEETSSLLSGTVVRCTWDFHAIRSDEIGLGPYSGSYDELTVRDGEIVDVFGYIETAKFGPQMWEPFAEWVSTTYPEDVAVMYESNFSDYLLTRQSIRLWERHTREYVETRSAETGPAESAPAPALVSAAPDVVRQGTCSDGARWRLEITQVKVGDRLKVRFILHRSPVGHRWHIHLRYKSHNIFTVYGHMFLQRIRVADDSGVVVVQVSRPGWNRERPVSPDGVDGRAVDWQTGQVCNVSAWYR
jgi:hypothetical protein